MSTASSSVVLLEREYWLSRDSELRVFIPCDAGTLDALTVSLLQKDATQNIVPQSRADQMYLEKLSTELGEKFNSNSCELNGSELLPNTIYCFGDFGTMNGGTATHTRSFGFYTNTGCTLRVKGPAKILHEIYHTDSVIQRRNILDIHYHLNGRRKDAMKENLADSFGPRVLVIGPDCTGKTTVAHSLVNYAARLGFHPCLIDLSNAIQTRESAELYNISSPMDPAEGTSLLPKLSYFFGSTDPCSNYPLLKHITSGMLEEIFLRSGREKAVRFGGFIIDCPSIPVSDETAAAQSTTGSTVDPGLDFLYHLIAEAHIDVVVTCGGERLRNLLRKHCAVVSYTSRGGSMTAATPMMNAEAQAAANMFGDGDGGDGHHPHTTAVANTIPERQEYFDSLLNQNPVGFQLFRDHMLHFISLEPSGGCTSWFKEERQTLATNHWRRYFFGSANLLSANPVHSSNPAAPGLKAMASTIELKWDDIGLQIVQLQAVSAASLAGLLPMDSDESKVSATTVSYVNELEYQSLLPGRLLMLAATTSLDGVTGKPRIDPVTGRPVDVDEKLQKGLGLGYLWVTAVDSASRKIVVLSPEPELPNKGRGLCFYLCETSLSKAQLLK